MKALKTQAASAKFLCALKELPDFSRHLGSDFNPEHLAMMTLSPSIDQCQNAWNDARNGRITETPIIQLQTPSVYDKTVAPEGHHVLSLWVYYLPPHLPDQSWSDMRQQYGEWLIDYVTGYAPNFRDAIIDWTLLTPEDIEERIWPHRWQHSPPRHDPAADDVTPPLARAGPTTVHPSRISTYAAQVVTPAAK